MSGAMTPMAKMIRRGRFIYTEDMTGHEQLICRAVSTDAAAWLFSALIQFHSSTEAEQSDDDPSAVMSMARYRALPSDRKAEVDQWMRTHFGHGHGIIELAWGAAGIAGVERRIAKKEVVFEQVPVADPPPWLMWEEA